MHRIVIFAALAVLLTTQASAQSKRTVRFEGLVALVVDWTTTPPRKAREVRAVLVDPTATQSKMPTTHLTWLAVEGDHTSKGTNESVGVMHGMTVWNVTGRELTFAVPGTPTSVDFSAQYIAQLETLKAGFGDAIDDVWDESPWIVGSRVRMRGGELAADEDTLVPCEFKKSKDDDSTDCADPCAAGGLARNIVYSAEFDTIKVFELGQDPGSARPELEITLGDDASVQISHLPFWSMEGDSHFREFYDLSVRGKKLDWDKRCNVFKRAECVTEVNLVTDKLVFCPPVVFGK